MKAVKIGKYRINLDKIAYIQERVSDSLQQRKSGEVVENVYVNAQEAIRGLVVTIYFPATAEDAHQSISLYTDNATRFLKAFDEYAGIES